jgi:undecaprenyl-diphosphatase
MDIWLHFGTLLAIVIVFRQSILRLIRETIRGATQGKIFSKTYLKSPEGQDAYLFLLIVLAMIPTGIVGVFFKDRIEILFEGSLSLLGLAFFFTAVLLFLTRFRGNAPDRTRGLITPWQALVVGAAQGIAVIPGVSRSGSTIAVALLLGISREQSGEFSFLIVLPAILGAMFLESLHGLGAICSPAFLFPALAGMIAAWLVGIVALKVLLKIVNHGNLYRFSFYCIFIGVLALWIQH